MQSLSVYMHIVNEGNTFSLLAHLILEIAAVLWSADQLINVLTNHYCAAFRPLLHLAVKPQAKPSQSVSHSDLMPSESQLSLYSGCCQASGKVSKAAAHKGMCVRCCRLPFVTEISFRSATFCCCLFVFLLLFCHYSGYFPPNWSHSHV